MTHALSISDLKVDTVESRILDVRIGERLGFANPLMIRKLIERNRAELEAHGIISTVEITPARSSIARVWLKLDEVRGSSIKHRAIS